MLQSDMQTWSSVLLCGTRVVELPCGLLLCVPWLGLKGMQYLGVVETSNGLEKPSAETNLTKKIRVVGESTMHILKSTRREGISRGTM